MAFLRYANARVVNTTNLNNGGWDNIRVASGRVRTDRNLVEQASKILGTEFDPSKYLLTHATIVASVDTLPVPGEKVGSAVVGGKKVVRKTASYRVKPECDAFINNNCFVPGTSITMADGTAKNIEDVVEGDMVLTHLGRARRVIRTMVREVDEEIRELKVRSSNERTRVTSEHPFFVHSENKNCFHCGADIRRAHKSIENLLGRFYCTKQCYYEAKVKNEDLLSKKEASFIEAGKLTDRDYSTTPIIRDTADIPGLTKGKARLLGLFAAEGYYNLRLLKEGGYEKVGCVWAFHEKEEETLARTVRELMQAEFGVECVVYHNSLDRGIRVTTRTNRESVAFFSKWIIGANARVKTLHPDLIHAPLEIQQEILRGWFDGDGCALDVQGGKGSGDFRLLGVTASRSLAYQMRILLHRLGVAPRLFYNKAEDPREGWGDVDGGGKEEFHSWAISCGGGYVSDLVKTTRFDDKYNAYVTRRGSVQKVPPLRFLKNHVLHVIEKNEPIHYKGPVHNFEVEEDHSYVANGVAVHNCDSFSRPVLLKAYPTFVGGHSFLEHVQIEELSKGRILDAVARDIGDSVYVDILVANDRKHSQLIRDIESGELSTLSMGCFLPGTQVSMADGTRVAIEDVQVGDQVLTHRGRTREVTNKQIRGGSWSVRRIEAVGVPSAITATEVHPFFVFRLPDVCACGCGESLPESYASGKRTSLPKRLSRRFRDGHRLRVLNPNGSYSLEEYASRRSRLDEIQSLKMEEVKAGDLKVGDFLCFPRSAFGTIVDTTPGRARLLGYFLAEGNFQKQNGKHHTVEFNFSLHEKETYAAEVARLLQEEFPGCNPRTYTGDESEGCFSTVVVRSEAVASWFLKHGGEYSHKKLLHPDVMAWSPDNQLHLLGAWINGDGTLQKGGVTSSVTVSYDLVCQMHAIMARCGIHARMYGRVHSKLVDVAEVVNGGLAQTLCEDGSYRRPSFQLDLGQTQAQVLSGYCDKVRSNPKFQTQAFRVLDDVVMFPITSIETQIYEGWVHDMEVEEDHSYVVEGVAVHNCTIDGSSCTKCGNWAADETEMCSHILHEKGNTFYDESGVKHRIAELCGDISIDPTGGVKFIEASWVKIPAFKGAVARNVVSINSSHSAKTAMLLEHILSSVPLDIVNNALRKVASDNHVASEDGSYAEEDGGENPFGEPAKVEEEAPKKEEAPKTKGMLDDAEADITDALVDKVKKRVKDQLQGPLPSSMAPNDTLVKQGSAYRTSLRMIVASSKTPDEVVRKIGSLNDVFGIKVPETVYSAALRVGSLNQYGSFSQFLKACGHGLQRRPTKQEVKTIIRIGALISAHHSRIADGNKKETK